MGNAVTNLPNSNDVFLADYDPTIGPALTVVEAMLGFFPPETLSGKVIAQTIPDYHAGDTVTLTAGDVVQAPIFLQAGQLISNLSVITAATAASTPTNQWAALCGPSDAGAGTDVTTKVLAVSADGTSTAITADTVITFALGTAYTVPTTGWYTVAVCVAGTTGPTVAGLTLGGAHGRAAVEAFLAGIGATGQTTPPAVGATVTELTAGEGVMLVYAT